MIVEFKKVGIRCPDCGREKIPANPADEVTAVCTNRDCVNYKIEFIAETRLTENEEAFAEAVLFRGEREGVWDVDRFIAGGSRSIRGAVGVDFAVITRINCAVIWIEYKESTVINFTPDQLMRFRKEQTNPRSVSRLCIAVPSHTDPSYITRAFYWSPEFFMTLPADLFGKETAPTLRWSGSKEIIERNLENSLYEVTKGSFGLLGTYYKAIPKDQVFNWFYAKLMNTAKNPSEELGKVYKPGVKGVTSVKELVKEIIMKTLMMSYRPLFSEDFEPVMWDNMPEFMSIKNDIYYIETERANWYILRRLIGLVAEDQLISFKFPNYQSFGVKEWEKYYTPLPKGASRLLDVLKTIWEETGKTTFLHKEIKELIGDRWDSFYNRVKHPENTDPLVKAGFAQFSRSRILITQKAMDYFTWQVK